RAGYRRAQFDGYAGPASVVSSGTVELRPLPDAACHRQRLICLMDRWARTPKTWQILIAYPSRPHLQGLNTVRDFRGLETPRAPLLAKAMLFRYPTLESYKQRIGPRRHVA